MTANIVVVGSCMVDFVSYAPRLPKPGETVHGKQFATNFGGKGANQCVAAAKLGGTTTFIARVGDDVWGSKYIENLNSLHVNSTHVKITENSSTGIAQIIVAESGENQIVIVGGANHHLCVNDIESIKDVLLNADVLVLQLETSQEVALKSLQLCRGTSILNGAPALYEYNQDLIKLPTIFCVNETEASIFTRLSVNNVREAEIAAINLLQKGCNSVLITLGSQGSVYVDRKDNKAIHIPSPSVECVDSTGAGDAFIGALAYLLANHKEFQIEKCIKLASVAAADSVTKPGTQISFPGPEIITSL